MQRKRTKKNIVKLETYDDSFNTFLVGCFISIPIVSMVSFMVLSQIEPYLIENNVNNSIVEAYASSDGWTKVMWSFGTHLFLVITAKIILICIVYYDVIKAFLKKNNPFYIKDGNIHIRR